MATQEARIKELLDLIALDWQGFWAAVGNMGSLGTAATTLVAAINEVKATADAAVAGTAPDASETVKGIVELATNGEAATGTDTTRAVTPAGVDAALDARVVPASATVAGISELASDAEALAFSATDRVITPGNLGAITNVNNGLAKLDGSGKVASAQLPSFVDDVVEAANFAALPGTGEAGKVYVTLDNGKTWRWGGSAYAEISAAPGSTDAVPEGSTNLYYTQTRADARVNALVVQATETTSGKAEIATTAEVTTGSDDQRIVTPSKLAARYTALVGDPDADLAAYYTAAKA